LAFPAAGEPVPEPQPGRPHTRREPCRARPEKEVPIPREVRRGQAVPLALERSLGDGVHRYAGTISCDRSGMQGYSVRVRPSHPEACDLLGTGLMTWWQG